MSDDKQILRALIPSDEGDQEHATNGHPTEGAVVVEIRFTYKGHTTITTMQDTVDGMSASKTIIGELFCKLFL